MPIAQSEVQYRLSGGASNSVPAASLGGAKSSTAVTGSTLFDGVTGAESAAGSTEYRCIYVHNAHATLTLSNARAYLTSSAGGRLSIGVGSSGISGTEQSVASETTAPASVAFSAPTDYAGGIALGNIPPGGHVAVWQRRVIPAGAAATSDSAQIRVTGDTLQ